MGPLSRRYPRAAASVVCSGCCDRRRPAVVPPPFPSLRAAPRYPGVHSLLHPCSKMPLTQTLPAAKGSPSPHSLTFPTTARYPPQCRESSGAPSVCHRPRKRALLLLGEARSSKKTSSSRVLRADDPRKSRVARGSSPCSTDRCRFPRYDLGENGGKWRVEDNL